MRLTILANADIESNIALNLLLRVFPRDITHVFLSAHSARMPDPPPDALKELLYMEQTFFQDIFFPLINREPLRPGQFMSFRQISNHFLIPVTRISGINSAAGRQALLNARPDVILLLRFGEILGYNVIAIPKWGVLNWHAGLLPARRGALPLLRALADGDAEVGASLHYVTDPGINSGPVVARSPLPVRPDKSLFWHLCQIYVTGFPAPRDALQTIARGETPSRQAQDVAEGRYYPPPAAADFARYFARGGRIADPRDIDMVAGYYRG